MRFLRRTVAAVLLLAASMTSLQAQNGSNFLTELGPNNAGTEFFFSCPSNWNLPGSRDFYIRIYITAPTATEVKIWVGGTLKRTLTTTPYEISTHDLTPADAQPIVRADEPVVQPDSIYLNKAIRITSDEPVIAYVMNRTSYTSDGMLLLPTSALGQEYIVGTYASVIGTTQELPSQFLVVAPYDSTVVTVTQPMASPNHLPGMPYTVRLNRGDVYSVMSVGVNGDMSGAVISANKPVAVIAGQECTYIPNLLNFCCCDHIVEFLLPVQSWGQIYHGVTFAGRRGNYYRIFGQDSNTIISINGVPYDTLRGRGGRGGVLGGGWLEYQDDNSPGLEITADKPVTVFQYNPSQAYDNVPSDPFYLGLTPMEQHGKEIIFSTPDQDFPKNYLTVITDSANFHAVEISPTGVDNWVKVKTLPGGDSLRIFPTKQNGKTFVGATMQITGGAYKMRAPEPMTGYSYGFSEYDSYGYPVAAFTSDLSSEDSTPPSMTMNRDSSTGVLSGTVMSLAKKGKSNNTLSLSKVALDKSASENFRLEIPNFQQALSTSTQYRLVPVDRKKPATATLYAVDMAGNRHSITGRYEPEPVAPDIRINGSAIAIGRTLVGATSSGRTTLINAGKDAATITSIRLADGTRGFTILGPDVPFKLDGAGHSMEIQVGFAPAGTGIFTDTVVVSSECCELFRFVVTGIAEQADIAISGTAITFTDARIETAVTGGTTVTNNGRDPVTVTGMRLAQGNRRFRLLGPAVPFTLGGSGGGNSMEITVEFFPLSIGTYSDTVILSNDDGVLFRVPVTGVTENDQVGAVPVAISGVLNGVSVAPNPARGNEASLGFTMERKGTISVALVDAAGKEIRTMGDGLVLDRGERTVKLDLEGVPSGSYFVRISAAGRSIVTPLVVTR